MGWGGDSFPGQSKAGGRLAFFPLVLWGQHLPGTSAPPDSSGSPMGWRLPEAGAGAETCTGIGPSRPCVGEEGQTLPWKGRAKSEMKPLAWDCLTCLWTLRASSLPWSLHTRRATRRRDPKLRANVRRYLWAAGRCLEVRSNPA